MLMRELEPVLRSYIIRAIRQAFVRSKVYDDVMKLSRVEKPRYKKDGTISKKKDVSYRCAGCSTLVKAGGTNVDHKIPVTDIASATSQMTIEMYIKKVFCSAGNLQVLCSDGKDSCHSKKTKQENKSRVKRDKAGKVLKTRKKAIKKPNKLVKLKI